MLPLSSSSLRRRGGQYDRYHRHASVGRGAKAFSVMRRCRAIRHAACCAASTLCEFSDDDLARSARSSRSTISRQAWRSLSTAALMPLAQACAYSLRGNIASLQHSRRTGPRACVAARATVGARSMRRVMVVCDAAVQAARTRRRFTPAQARLRTRSPYSRTLSRCPTSLDGRRCTSSAFGPEHAVLADPRIELLEVGPAARWQRPQARSFDLPVHVAQRALSRPTISATELAVGRQVVELACATQQQRLVERALRLPWRDSMEPFSWLSPRLLRLARMP